MLSEEISVMAKSRKTASPFQLQAMLKKCAGAYDRASQENANPAIKAILEKVQAKIQSWLNGDTQAPHLPILIALDGRAAAGKSSLAETLGQLLNVSVFHMDDFYLTPERKTADRLAEPGGNVDRERFFADVLNPMVKGKPFTYQALIPHVWVMGEERNGPYTDMAIVEGAYTLHPMLRPFYRPDLSFFVDVDPAEQLRRIRLRNGADAAEVFRTKWIPLEEAYISLMRPDLFCNRIIAIDRNI